MNFKCGYLFIWHFIFLFNALKNIVSLTSYTYAACRYMLYIHVLQLPKRGPSICRLHILFYFRVCWINARSLHTSTQNNCPRLESNFSMWLYQLINFVVDFYFSGKTLRLRLILFFLEHVRWNFHIRNFPTCLLQIQFIYALKFGT